MKKKHTPSPPPPPLELQQGPPVYRPGWRRPSAFLIAIGIILIVGIIGLGLFGLYTLRQTTEPSIDITKAGVYTLANGCEISVKSAPDIMSVFIISSRNEAISNAVSDASGNLLTYGQSRYDEQIYWALEQGQYTISVTHEDDTAQLAFHYDSPVLLAILAGISCESSMRDAPRTTTIKTLLPTFTPLGVRLYVTSVPNK